MGTAMVAQFYRIDPDVVDYEWSYIDFVDRREYMFIYNEIQSREGED